MAPAAPAAAPVAPGAVDIWKSFLFVNKTTIYVGLVLFLRVTSYSRERSRHSEIKLPLLTSRVRTVPALRVTSAMGVLFTTGIQIVMVVLFPNGGSTILCVGQ
jgi:type II secretory pathway component PulF